MKDSVSPKSKSRKKSSKKKSNPNYNDYTLFCEIFSINQSHLFISSFSCSINWYSFQSIKYHQSNQIKIKVKFNEKIISSISISMSSFLIVAQVGFLVGVLPQVEPQTFLGFSFLHVRPTLLLLLTVKTWRPSLGSPFPKPLFGMIPYFLVK